MLRTMVTGGLAEKGYATALSDGSGSAGSIPGTTQGPSRLMSLSLVSGEVRPVFSIFQSPTLLKPRAYANDALVVASIHPHVLDHLAINPHRRRQATPPTLHYSLP